MVADVPVLGEAFAHYRLDARVEPAATAVTDAFLATDTRSGEEIMLEILRAGVSGVERARFGMRARRLRAVSHAGILAVLEAAPGHCAFEAPTNHPLDEHAGVAIARARQKLCWLAQIASAVAALHAGGVVHGALSLDGITVAPDTTVKLTVFAGGDVTGSPLDDVRAFVAAACELLLGADAPGVTEPAFAERLHAAGAPRETAAVLARVRGGGAATSEDLAGHLAPFADYAGPSTEPLLPIVPRRE